MRDSPFNRRMEAVADIAQMAGLYRHHSTDSRKDISDYIQWAEEFEQARVVDPDGNESYFGKDYMTAIEEFTLRKLEAEGTPKKSMQLSIALNEFLHTWADGMLLHDLGEHLSCVECNALADLLQANEYHESAENLLDGHCMGDDVGDDPAHIERRRRIERDQAEQAAL
jgi:hypothetical protein